MIDDKTVTIDRSMYPLHRKICWSAILVGAVVGVGLSFLLNLFGVAIGLTSFSMSSDGSVVMAVGGMIGVVVGIISSMMAAGYAAGYLGRCYCPKRDLGIVYGFTTWTVALLMSAVITAHVGNYVTAYTQNLSRTVVVTSVNDANVNDVDVITSPAAESNANVVKLSTTPNTLAWSAMIVFALFFISALSCCVGAHWAMVCRKHDL